MRVVWCVCDCVHTLSRTEFWSSGKCLEKAASRAAGGACAHPCIRIPPYDEHTCVKVSLVQVWEKRRHFFALCLCHPFKWVQGSNCIATIMGGSAGRMRPRGRRVRTHNRWNIIKNANRKWEKAAQSTGAAHTQNVFGKKFHPVLTRIATR